MRILFVLREFPVASETFFIDQITGLIDRGHDVSIAASRFRRGEVPPELESILAPRTLADPPMPVGRIARVIGAGLHLLAHLHRRELWRALAYRGISAGERFDLFYFSAQLLKGERDYDVIRSGFGTNGILGMRLRKLGVIRGPLVTSFEGFDITSRIRTHGRRLYEELFAEGDLFLPVCDHFRERLLGLGCPATKTLVHVSGINTAAFAPAGERRRNGIPRIVTVARLVEKKGIDTTLKALSRLRARGVEFEYVLAGDGPLRATLEKLAESAGLADRISFTGWASPSAVAGLLRSADLFVLASRVSREGDEEATPNVLKEAMAMEVPVVATRHAGIPELVEDERTGLLVDENDDAALADAIERMLSDEALRHRLAIEGRKAVLERYDVERLNDRLVGIYETLGTRGAARPEAGAQ